MREDVAMQVGLIVPMGDELEVGVPQAYREIRALARAAEAGGLDAVWVYDHLLSGGPEQAAESPWEAWTLLTALAEATERVRLGALVLCAAFRDPGVLARMADTLQEISGDRLVLGLGAGWHQPEFDAFGLPFDERVDRFDDSLRIVSTMLREGRATFEGTHHRVVDAPVRERDRRMAPEILVAAKRPRMLRLTAEHADSWNLAWFGLPGPGYRDVAAGLDQACERISRDPATLRRTVGFRIAATPGDDDPLRVVRGDADRVGEALAAWAAEGVDEVICWPEPNNGVGLDLLLEGTRRYRAAVG
jgi:alkanesulfonate monooxygenase SsuD/methylene tetrahydromethanopterin reductase-like flavin-dependent oxidoreductase (luciferase family)